MAWARMAESGGSSGQSEKALSVRIFLPSTSTSAYSNFPNCSMRPTMSVVSVAGAWVSFMKSPTALRHGHTSRSPSFALSFAKRATISETAAKQSSGMAA